ncbi:MAG: ATP-binding protein [Terracidiphilus sp.]|jgi:DNA replication protein DnaC
MLEISAPQLLLEHHLKELRLPTILREYDKVARQCAVEQLDYQRYLLRMTELELLDRERRATERRIRQAKFPVIKTMDSFDFFAISSVNKTLVLELARCEFLARRENVLLLGNSGTGKTQIALGLAACQCGHRVRFITTGALVSELIEARDEKKLLRFQKQIVSYELLIVDELGFVLPSKTGAELLFEMLRQRECALSFHHLKIDADFFCQPLHDFDVFRDLPRRAPVDIGGRRLEWSLEDWVFDEALAQNVAKGCFL